MYWKFKLPLIIIMVLILGSIVYSGVNFYLERQAANTNAQQSQEPQPVVSSSVAPRQPPLVVSTSTAVQSPKTFTVEEIGDDRQTQPAPLEQSDAQLAPIPLPPAANAQDLKPLTTAPDKTLATAPDKTLPPAPTQLTVPQLPPPTPVPAPSLKEPVAQAPQPPAAATRSQLEQRLNQAAALIQQGKLLAARTLAQEQLSAAGVKEYDSIWRKAAGLISDINRRFTFSTLPCPEKTNYRIQEGDMLVRIAHKQKASLLSIYAMNPGIKPRTLWVGRNIKYMAGDWSIKVSKSNFILTLYLNGTLFRVYPVGIGKDDRTPVGTFRIKDKVINPAWDSPEGRILPNDPRNILGTRWMGLLATGTTSDQLIGYGIHGTTLPDTVGTPSSAGCVRLKNQDIEDLFTYIPEPDSAVVPVVIIP